MSIEGTGGILVENHRRVVVYNVNGKVQTEFTAVDGNVRIKNIPSGSANRPVALEDLRAAVAAL